MPKVKDGNVQDMSVHDKEHPALAATEEAQDVSALDQIVVPMPTFTDPENPAAAQGSINMTLDEHPLEHSEDYGDQVQGGDNATSTIDTHAKEAAKLVEGGHPGGREAVASTSSPDEEEDRSEWLKADWQAQARSLGLSSSGNTDAVKSRVEEYEAEVAEVKDWKAGDWQDEIGKVEDQEDLDALKESYEASGASFTTVESAFTAKEEELAENEDES